MQIIQKLKNEPIQIIIAVILILIMVIPLFVLALYANPSADDFSLANGFNKNSQSDSSYFSVVTYMAADFYNRLGGSYFGNHMAALNPFFIYGIEFVPISLIGIIAFYLVSVFIAIRAALKYIFGCLKWSVTFWFYSAVLFLSTQCLSLRETFYWYGGAAAYTVTFCIMLLGLMFFIKAYKANRTTIVVYTALGAVLLFLACGGPLLFSSFILMIMLALFIRAVFLKHNRLLVTVFFVVCLTGSMINALAPGNFNRQEMAQGESVISAKMTIWYTLDIGVNTYTVTLPLIMIFTVLLILTPLIVIVVGKSRLKFKNPLPMAIWSVLTLFACILPFVYGIGVQWDMPPRYETQICILAIGIILFNYVYLIGWLTQSKKIDFTGSSIRVTIMFVMVLALLSGIKSFPIENWNSYNITANYSQGVVQQHRYEARRFLNDISASNEDVIVVLAPQVEYHLLRGLDLQEGEDYWVNRAIAKYLGKSKIHVVLYE